MGSTFRVAILLSCINAVICANPVGNIVYARDGRKLKEDVSRIIKDNHLEEFCYSWLGGSPTITTTKTDLKEQYSTVTVGTVLTVTEGVTTVTSGVMAAQEPGTMVPVQTTYITETVTNLSTAVQTISSFTPVSTKTVTATVATNTITSTAGVITSIETATSTITSLTSYTTTITATFGTPAPSVTVARRHEASEKQHLPREVPDCLEYASDDLISAGCSLIYPPKTVTRTETVRITSIKGAQTSTIFTSTTTVPGKIQTVTSASTPTIPKPTVTITIKATSTVLSTISSSSTTIISTTLTETLSATVTSTVLSTSTSLTTTTVTTTTTSTAPIATYTACPGQNQVKGAFAIGVHGENGSFDSADTTTANECCLRCYDPAKSRRCSAWRFNTPNSCVMIVDAKGPSGASATCPNGLGDYILMSDSDTPDTELGGPGPCAGNNV